LVLVGTLASVLLGLEMAVLRGGLALASAVLAYGLVVHATNRSARLQSLKEPAVGVLFALGVTLVVWVEGPAGGGFGPLLVATVGAAVLFTANCVLVAAGEREQDRQQGFLSFVERRPEALHPLLVVSWLVMPLAFALGYAEYLPARVAVAFTFAVPVMLGPMVWRLVMGRVSGKRGPSPAMETPPGVGIQTWWDTALWLAPAATMWWMA